MTCDTPAYMLTRCNADLVSAEVGTSDDEHDVLLADYVMADADPVPPDDVDALAKA